MTTRRPWSVAHTMTVVGLTMAIGQAVLVVGVLTALIGGVVASRANYATRPAGGG